MDFSLSEYLNALFCSYQQTKDYWTKTIHDIDAHSPSSIFVFDLDADKCRYFCPSIKNITGNCCHNFLYKGMQYFKTLIHPQDYSTMISEIVTYILYIKRQNGNGSANDQIKSLTCRIRHKNGFWIRINLHVLYKNAPHWEQTNILVGYLEKEEYPHHRYNSTFHNISIREREVLQLIGNGDSSKIIADKLHISETTAITHRKNLIQKLHVKNTAELIKKAAMAKIIN